MLEEQNNDQFSLHRMSFLFLKSLTQGFVVGMGDNRKPCQDQVGVGRMAKRMVRKELKENL